MAQRTDMGGRWTARQRWTLMLLFLVITCNYIDRGVLGILQEQVKAELKFSDTMLGLVSGPMYAIFYALSGLPTARFAERRDRARVLSTLIAAWSVMTMVCGMAGNFVQLALARAGVGLAEGGCVPISHALMSEHFGPRQRGRAMAVLAAGSPAAGIIAPLAGGVVAELYGWRAAFLIVGLPGLALAVLVAMTVRGAESAGAEQARRSAPSHLRRDVGALFANRAFRWIFVASAFLATANAGVMFFTAPYFLRNFEMSLSQVGALYAVIGGAGGFAGTFLAGYLADRYAGDRGRSFVLIPAFGTVVAGITFAVAFAQTHWLVAAVFVLIGSIATDLKAPSLAAVQNIAPANQRATASAVLMLAVTACGTGVGAPIVGAISDWLASAYFPALLGGFAEQCPGGRPLTASPELAAACREAGALGVRVALVSICSLFIVAGLFFYRAAAHMMLDSAGEAEPRGALSPDPDATFEEPSA